MAGRLFIIWSRTTHCSFVTSANAMLEADFLTNNRIPVRIFVSRKQDMDIRNGDARRLSVGDFPIWKRPSSYPTIFRYQTCLFIADLLRRWVIIVGVHEFRFYKANWPSIAGDKSDGAVLHCGILIWGKTNAKKVTDTWSMRRGREWWAWTYCT